MSGNAGGPRRAYGDHDLCGVYYAIVTQNDDLKGPGGRVKVRFPWMPEGKRDQSHWAHVCAPMMGGKEGEPTGYGVYFMPEIEDAVFVVFLAGDIRSPVVIGGAWSEKDRPPEVNEDGENDFRVIKSRSGHRVLFDDTKNSKLILTDRKDENLVALGPHAKAGQSPKNTYEVPAPPGIDGSPTEGVSIAAMEGKLDVWCPAGTLTIEAPTVELTTSKDSDIHVGELSASGSTTELVSGSAGKYKGSAIRIGSGGASASAPRAVKQQAAAKPAKRPAPVAARQAPAPVPAPALAPALAPAAALAPALEMAAAPAAPPPIPAVASESSTLAAFTRSPALPGPPPLPSTALSIGAQVPGLDGAAANLTAPGVASIPSVPSIPGTPGFAGGGLGGVAGGFKAGLSPGNPLGAAKQMGQTGREMGTQPLRQAQDQARQAKEIGREAKDRPLADAKKIGRDARERGTQPLGEAKDIGRGAKDAGRDAAGAPKREAASRLGGFKSGFKSKVSDAGRGRIDIPTGRRGGGKPPIDGGDGDGE